MNMRKLIFLSMLAFGILTVTSCNKDDSTSDPAMASVKNGNESHNQGKNCMGCHKSGGSGSGIFNVAGTVYNSAQSSTYANAVVKLYTAANGGGTFRATVNADALGNFYTTASVDFSGGLYPAVSSTSGSVAYMPASITTGACGSCHGSSTGKIYVQ